MIPFTRTVFALTLSVVIGCQAMTGSIRMETPRDAAITPSVKESLTIEKTVNLTPVDVSTSNGTVYLSGVVPSLEARERAVKRAWTVSGVQTVVNHLIVQE
jgi:osmotically-inducible protein OsmY